LKVFMSERHEREREKALNEAPDNAASSEFQSCAQEAEAVDAKMHEDRDASIENAEIYMDLMQESKQSQEAAESGESLRVISARMHGKVVRYVEAFCEQFIPLQAEIGTLVRAAKQRSTLWIELRKRMQQYSTIQLTAAAHGNPLPSLDYKQAREEALFKSEIPRSMISRVLSVLHGSELFKRSVARKKMAKGLAERGLSLLPAFREEDEDGSGTAENKTPSDTGLMSQFDQMEHSLNCIVEILTSYRSELESVYSAYAHEIDEALADVPGNVRIGPLLINEGLPLEGFVKLVGHMSGLL
jgi:hypothetical protein